MAEMSPEAVVAGEAASIAVEELHSREEQAEQAAMAELGASEAIGMASDAQAAAMEATGAAAAAYETAAMVAEEVEDTRTTATEAVIVAETAVDYAEQNHREIGELKDMFAQFLARTASQESPESNVQEVAVDERANTESAPEASEESTPAPESRPDGRRLGRRARRNS